jgi:DHA2 family multidrug resistance protein-like MFS transporter
MPVGPAVQPGRDPNACRLSVLSVVLLLAMLLPFIYGVKTLAKDDSLAIALGTIAVGAGFGVWFVVRQLRAGRAAVRQSHSQRSAGVFILAATALGGMYLMITQYLQRVGELSPLQTAQVILPGALLLVGASIYAPILARRARPGNIIAAGPAVQVIGYLMLTQVGSTAGLGLLIASFIVLYPGVNPAMAFTTNLVVGSVPPEKAGAASGLSTTANDLGISLGIALIGSIGVATYRNEIEETLPAGLPADVAAAAQDSIDGAVSAASELSTDLGAAVLEPARAAFTSGLNLGALIAAVVAAVLAATRLRHVPPTGSAPAAVEEKPADVDAA